jgi:hypothetical protein
MLADHATVMSAESCVGDSVTRVIYKPPSDDTCASTCSLQAATTAASPTVLRREGKIHRVDPDFGSAFTVSNRDSQTAGSTGQVWVNPVDFRLMFYPAHARSPNDAQRPRQCRCNALRWRPRLAARPVGGKFRSHRDGVPRAE